MRAADWRFLLPRAATGAFEQLLLLGGSAGLGAYVADLGIARRVSRTGGEHGQADVVVALADADVTLDELTPHIAGRACVYIEIDRRAAGKRLWTPRRMMRVLREAGFDAVTGYWVKPGFPRRDMYLPFARPGALQWYLDTVYRATSPARRVLKGAMRGLAQHDAFAPVVPCYALVASRGIGSTVPALLEHVASGAHRADPVLLAAGETDWNRLVYVLFDGASPRPAAVVKVPRAPMFNETVEREHAALRDISRMIAPAMLASIPSSTLLRVGDLSVCAETCVGGASLASRVGAGLPGALDDLRGAAAWLASFHRETTRGHALVREWVREELAGRLGAEYERCFGLTADERRLFDVARQAVPATTDDLPIVWQHVDFGPWNIYREGAHVSVIDWESARRGPALADLLYFVMHWGAAVRGCATPGDRVRHFERLFRRQMPRDAVAQALERCVSEYMAAVGVPPALLPHILLYTVVEHAVGRSRWLVKSGHRASRDVAVNEYVGCVEALARHAGTLFGAAGKEGVVYAAS